MIRGIHAPNRRFAMWSGGRLWVTPELWVVMNEAKPEGVKLLHIEGCEHGWEEYAALRDLGIMPEAMVVRCPNSRITNGPYKGWNEYADELAVVINRWFSYGVRVFQIDNEPNVEGGWDRIGFGPPEYQWFIRQVVIKTA